NPDLNFLVASCSGIIFCCLLARLKVAASASMEKLEIGAKKVSLEDALNLLTLPRFWALILFVIGTCIYGVYDQQFPVYF
ncbi:MFS transporter, partial [Escherichia coli]